MHFEVKIENGSTEISIILTCITRTSIFIGELPMLNKYPRYLLTHWRVFFLINSLVSSWRILSSVHEKFDVCIILPNLIDPNRYQVRCMKCSKFEPGLKLPLTILRQWSCGVLLKAVARPRLTARDGPVFHSLIAGGYWGFHRGKPVGDFKNFVVRFSESLESVWIGILKRMFYPLEFSKVSLSVWLTHS